MPMWTTADVRIELEDVEKAIEQCEAEGSLGYKIYWSGYGDGLEAVRDNEWGEDEVRSEIKQLEKTIKQCRELGDIVGAVGRSGHKRALEVVLNEGAGQHG